MNKNNPVGYHIRNDIECCANCIFGGYLGDSDDPYRMCICEIMGECPDSDYASIAVEPLGICKAYKGRLNIKFKKGKRNA